MNRETATTYFKAWQARDIKAIAATLREDVTFVGPLTRFEGRDAVLASFEPLLPVLNAIDLRRTCVDSDIGMAVYDFVFAEPVGRIRMAELLTFKERLIGSIEMFFNPRPLLPAG